jgi:hypothetical protein
VNPKVALAEVDTLPGAGPAVIVTEELAVLSAAACACRA